MRLDVPEGDDILGRAVRFLIAGGDDKAAGALVDCDLDIVLVRVHEPSEPHLDYGFSVTYVLLAGRVAYDMLTADNFDSEEFKLGESIHRALGG